MVYYRRLFSPERASCSCRRRECRLWRISPTSARRNSTHRRATCTCLETIIYFPLLSVSTIKFTFPIFSLSEKSEVKGLKLGIRHILIRWHAELLSLSRRRFCGVIVLREKSRPNSAKMIKRVLLLKCDLTEIERLRRRPLDGYLLHAAGDDVLLLLARHAEVGYLDGVVVCHEAVPGGEVAVDAVLGLEVAHAGRRVAAHRQQRAPAQRARARAQECQQRSACGINVLLLCLNYHFNLIIVLKSVYLRLHRIKKITK